MNDHPNTALPCPPTAQAPDSPDRVRSQPDTYFRENGFRRDIEAHAAISTGYGELDRVRPFSPGLYCLGAQPGTGATNFCTQMADQIAASGQTVLYFSLQHTVFELSCRSLSRGFYREGRAAARDSYPAPSCMDIMRGAEGCRAELAEQADAYARAVGDRLTTVHNDRVPMTVEAIAETIDAFSSLHSVKPVVIIDCLQLVAPSPGATALDAKASAAHVVRSLKAKQIHGNLTMLLALSLEGQSYLDPIGIENFWNHGGLEYAADVLWGLQPSVMRTTEFLHENVDCCFTVNPTTPEARREMLMKDMQAATRHVDLVCVKDRDRAPDYCVEFIHYADHCLFWPQYDPEAPDARITRL